MGVCWLSTGDTSKSKNNRLTNQVITATQYQPTHDNSNIPKETNKSNINTNIEIKNNINLNTSFEESVKLFPDMPEWEGGITKGYGIKQMPAYKCNLKIDELNKKREEFWSSKTKLKTKWKLNFIIKTILGQLNINMCTDDQVNIFRVPNYCINDPHFQFELLDNNDSKGEKIEIKLFDVINQKQNKLTVLDSITGNELIEKYASEENIDLNKKKIRLLFGGGIIKGNETLFQHKVKNGFKIQVCISDIEI